MSLAAQHLGFSAMALLPARKTAQQPRHPSAKIAAAAARRLVKRAGDADVLRLEVRVTAQVQPAPLLAHEDAALYEILDLHLVRVRVRVRVQVGVE